MSIDLIRYREQFQLGISCGYIYLFDRQKHFHIWFDLGFHCLEITIGND